MQQSDDDDVISLLNLQNICLILQLWAYLLSHIYPETNIFR